MTLPPIVWWDDDDEQIDMKILKINDVLRKLFEEAFPENCAIRITWENFKSKFQLTLHMKLACLPSRLNRQVTGEIGMEWNGRFMIQCWHWPRKDEIIYINETFCPINYI